MKSAKTSKSQFLDRIPFEGIILILVGIILLSNTIGLVSWRVWLIFVPYAIPVTLIYWGINVLVNDKKVAAMLDIGVLLTVLVIILVRYVATPVVVSPTGELLLTAAEYPNVQSRVLDLDLSLGSYTISADESNNIVQIENIGDRSDLGTNVAMTDNELKITVNTVDDHNLFGINNGSKSPANYQILLGQKDLITDLNLDNNFGESIVNLNQQKLRKIVIDNNFGNVELDLPDNAKIKVDVSVAFGSVRVFEREFDGIVETDFIVNENADDSDLITIKIDSNFGAVRIF